MNTTNMRKVLCIQGMPQAGLDLFAARDDIEVEIVHEGPDTDLAEHLADAHAVTLFGTLYGRALIDATPNLAVASRFGVGFDSVDVAALTERGVPLMIAGTANSVSVAEHAMFMMLDLAKLARHYHAGVAAGRFDVRKEREALDLCGKRLVVVGFGRIGSRTVKRAAAFEMDVQVYDPYVGPGGRARGRGGAGGRSRCGAGGGGFRHRALPEKRGDAGADRRGAACAHEADGDHRQHGARRHRA